MLRKLAVGATALTAGLIGGVVASPLLTGAAPAPTAPRSVQVAVTPARLLDTRAASPTVDGKFQGIGKLGAGATLNLMVTGRGGVPASATAVVLNVTAVDPSVGTFLTLWPAGVARPLSSNLDPAPGQPPTPNLVTVGVGTGGQVSIFNSVGTIDVIADVTAYYVAANDQPVTLGFPGAAMVPNDVGVVTFSGPCVRLNVAGGGSFRTPVVLPQGATITHVTFTYLSATATTFTLFRSVIETPTSNNDILGPLTVNNGSATMSKDINPPVTIQPGEGVYARAELDATSFFCGLEITYLPPA